MYLKMIDQLPKTVEFLDKEDRARLDAAVNLYNETITENARRRYESQTPRERKRYAVGYVHKAKISDYKEKIKLYKTDPTGQWWKAASSMAHMFCGGVYKSALLHRLLEGKAPLKFPPPCAHSYPWYSVVENNAPQTVTDLYLGNGVRSLGSLMTGTGGAKSTAPKALLDRNISQIIINQTGYVITDANEAGIDLLVTIAKMYETPDGMVEDTSVMNSDGKKYPIITHKHPLIADIIDAYDRGPEIFVKHGEWPGWRLFVATQEPRSTDEEWGQKMMNGKPFGAMRADRGINPLDLIFQGLNPRIVDHVEEQDEQEDPKDLGLERIHKALNNRDPRIEEPKPMPIVPTAAALEELSKFPMRAPRKYVKMQWDVWHIQRLNSND